MRTLTLALVVALGACSTVKSGLTALGGGKPHQVTVINNIEAPQPQVVVVQAPVVAQAQLEVAEPTPRAQLPASKRNQLKVVKAIKAVTSGAVAGALVGTAVGYAIDGEVGAVKGAAIGAGAGAVGGVAAVR